MDNSPVPSNEGINEATRELFRETVDRCVRQADTGVLRLKVARETNVLEKHRDMHFHFRPEVFFQLDGRTEFSLPGEEIILNEGDMFVIPAGVPHLERVYAGDRPFRNVVVGFYSNTVSMHVAHEASPQSPAITHIQFWTEPQLLSLIEVVDALIRTYHGRAPARDLALRGYALAFFSNLLNFIGSEAGPSQSDSGRIFQTKWLIRDQISNPELNVKFLAGLLHCSPDYLSHLFATEVGETLTKYIQRQRILGASQALRTTPLTVSEIAWASGFADAGYFARVFKKFVGMSPLEYRQREDDKRRRSERNPKTIYYDHVDYHPGRVVGLDAS